jgi:integrase
MSSLEISINNFIRNLENNCEIMNICLAEKKYIDNKYLTIGSRKSTYSTYRKHIKNSDLGDDVKYETLKFLKLTKDENIAYSNDKIDKVNFKLENLKVITDVEGYIETGISLIKKPSYIERILGFCCVTGRRPAEIGCSADFSFVDINHLEFSGQLKTKSDELKSYVIPCLMNTSDFLRHWQVFREQHTKNVIDKKEHNLNDFYSTELTKKFNSSYAKDMSMRTKKYFNKYLGEDVTTYNLRHTYATIATMKFNNMSKNLYHDDKFRAKILGHNERDLVSVDTYKQFLKV